MPFLDSYFDAPFTEDLPPADLTDLYVTPDTVTDDPSGDDGGMLADTDFSNIETEDVFVFVAHFPPSGTASSTGQEPDAAETEGERVARELYEQEMENFSDRARHSALRSALDNAVY